jgi:hypothetical protein
VRTAPAASRVAAASCTVCWGTNVDAPGVTETLATGAGPGGGGGGGGGGGPGGGGGGGGVGCVVLPPQPRTSKSTRRAGIRG